jgi:hypothetical protein
LEDLVVMSDYQDLRACRVRQECQELKVLPARKAVLAQLDYKDREAIRVLRARLDLLDFRVCQVQQGVPVLQEIWVQWDLSELRDLLGKGAIQDIVDQQVSEVLSVQLVQKD